MQETIECLQKNFLFHQGLKPRKQFGIRNSRHHDHYLLEPNHFDHQKRHPTLEISMQKNLKQIKKTPHQNLHIIFGVVNDKNVDKLLNLLPKNAKYYFCKANIERGLCKEKLKQKAVFLGLNGDSYNSVKSAYLNAKKNASDEDLIFIAGSAFVIAEII